MHRTVELALAVALIAGPFVFGLSGSGIFVSVMLGAIALGTSVTGFLGEGSSVGIGFPLESTPALDASGLAERFRREAVWLLDVREPDEWAAGHVPGSVHLPYYELRDGVPEGLQDGDRPLAVACSAGVRSSVAASLLRRSPIGNVEHVAEGGVADLAQHGIELEEG